MLSFFIVCGSAGFTFLVGSVLFGHFGHGDGHHDGDAGIHGLPILGPGSLAAGLAGFGCGGYVAMSLGLPAMIALGPATGMGVGMWLGSAWLTRALTRLGSGGRSVKAGGFIGEQASVSVSIPQGGVGEVTFTSQGDVVSAPARAASGLGVEKGTIVTIEAMHEGVAMVGPSVDTLLKEPKATSVAAAKAKDPEGQG